MIAVNGGRAANTHASSVDTSQCTRAEGWGRGVGGRGEGGEERGGEEASTQSLKALKDIQSWDSALCDITGAG